MKLLHRCALAIPFACSVLAMAAGAAVPLWNEAAPFPNAAELARLELRSQRVRPWFVSF
jgi:hypothetical protein